MSLKKKITCTARIHTHTRARTHKTRISGLRTQLLSDKRNHLFFATENAQETVA